MKIHQYQLLLTTVCLFFACSKEESTNIPLDIEEEELTIIGPCSDKKYELGSLQCSPTLSTDELEVVTWNIENFPMQSETTIKVANIIEDLDADIYALQEIGDVDEFSSLVEMLSSYDGVAVDVRGSIELAFLYKVSSITEISNPVMLFTGETNPFPREPVEVDIKHTNGLTVKLINIHLKCCDGSESRRKAASNKLKAYVDDNHSEDEVIILGDWNEDFDSGSSFTNFILDSQNFAFVDLPIYQDFKNDYSYPCVGASFCPSHIDHILITDELCDNLVATHTIRLDDCVTNYLTEISDHRPVMVSLKADE